MSAQPLPKFNPEAKCPKCDFDDIHTAHYPKQDILVRTRYSFDEAREHLRRRCKRCGFEWAEATVQPVTERAKGVE